MKTMGKKIISSLLMVMMLMGVWVMPAFGAASLPELLALVPSGAREFNASGSSNNGLNGPITLW